MELGTGLGHRNHFALPVRVKHFVLFMGMAVDEPIHSRYMGQERPAAPHGDGSVAAQMGHQDHRIRPLFPGFLHRILDLSVKLHSCFVLTESIDEMALSVLEEPGRGRNQSARGGDPDERHLPFFKGKDPVGCQYGFPGIQPNEVAAGVPALQFFGQGQEIVHAVIGFMVAGDGEIIARPIQDPDHGPSVGEFSQRFPLDGIPGVQEQGLGFQSLLLLFVSRYPGQGQVPVHPAVDVVGMEQHHLGPGLERQQKGQESCRSPSS